MARKKATRRTPQIMSAAEISSAIYEAGHEWVAASHDVFDGETPGLGLVVSDEEIAATAKAIEAVNAVDGAAASVTAPPSSVDWRNNPGSWVTPVQNQGSCGSCVSFATCATIEARLNIVCKNPNLDVDLSEAHLFFCGCGQCCDQGWYWDRALDFCKSNGVGLETDFPYSPQNQACRQIAPYVKIREWQALYSTVDRKTAIASKGPVVAGIEVYDDFYRYSSGVYRKLPNATFQGLHAVCVTGYNDLQQCWIVKNSWGTNWGESGFVQIGYGEIGIDSRFAFYDADVECPERPEPSPPQPDVCQQYVPFLQKVIAAAQQNYRLRACLRYYICGRGWRPYGTTQELQIVRYVIQILRACPQYRDAFCRLIG